ncbi:MAG: hypothetical protein U5K79_25415 [Cyclobacteriaceae bacterium]|nr:hypothetical protein [Cyclobacteriaceae bacterium]
MKQTKDYLNDICEIRQIMERSSNFISLSGLSGILAGIYALIGSYAAYRIVYIEQSILMAREVYIDERDTIIKLSIIAAIVLILAVATGLYLTAKKNSKTSFSFSDPGFRNLLINLIIPLVTGGMCILILVSRGFYSIVAPAFRILDGLSLINGSKYTVTDIKYLGIVEIILGLICALLPGYGLIFWAVGFGLMHILYGTIMYFKFDRSKDL